MCRHVAYLGPPVRVADLLLAPRHSLLEQTWAPADMRGSGTVNVDGFGFGWYDGPGDDALRYRRAVPALLKDRKLVAVGPFLEQPSFPDAAGITAFYAESVSLVSYLVELKGSKAFATFLREAPRRGYARALASHYGFKDPADLQDRWQRHVLGGE